jgi:hypothetical protein
LATDIELKGRESNPSWISGGTKAPSQVGRHLWLTGSIKKGGSRDFCGQNMFPGLASTFAFLLGFPCSFMIFSVFKIPMYYPETRIWFFWKEYEEIVIIF